MPILINRLQSEVRSLQIQLRRKSEQTDASERKVADLEHRMMPLLETKEREYKLHQQPGQQLTDDQTSRKQAHLIESQQTALDKQMKLIAVLSFIILINSIV